MNSPNKKLAIIDIGSNTIRLVIYNENDHGTFKETENIKAVARLRHYLNNDFVLKNEGINLLLKILKGFKEIVDFHKVHTVKCVATATVRQAINKAYIIHLVKETTGFEIEILTEEEEAFYGYYAIAQTTPVEEGITIDIGGGSTEITYFKNRELLYSHSFPFGVVSLKEQFIKGNMMTNIEKEELLLYIIQSFDQLPWLKELNVPIIAIGGSARNIAQIDQHIKKYPLAGIHQYSMSTQDLNEISLYLESMDLSELEKLEGLSKDRADIIVPALEVFVQLCQYTNATKFMFSRKGLRDGIYLKEFGCKKDHKDTTSIIHESIHELINNYGIDKEHSEHVAYLAQELYEVAVKVCRVEVDKDSRDLIDLSARVYYFGQYVDSDGSSQHTFYLLANQSINGLEHKDRIKLALISSFKNKSLLKQYAEPYQFWFSKEELEKIRIAGALIKLASALNASKRGIVQNIESYILEKNELIISIRCKGNYFVEKYQAEKQLRHLEKALKVNIKLNFSK